MPESDALSRVMAQRFVELGSSDQGMWDNLTEAEREQTVSTFKKLFDEFRPFSVIAIEPGDVLTLLFTNNDMNHEELYKIYEVMQRAYPGVEFHVILAGEGTQLIKGQQAQCGDTYAGVVQGVEDGPVQPYTCTLYHAHMQVDEWHKDEKNGGVKWKTGS